MSGGETTLGKYRLLRELGRGGMGSVWVAEHQELRSHVAVKLIDPTRVRSPEALARFVQEAQAAAALQSPHVVHVFDFGWEGDTPYLAMELLRGETLAQRLSRVGRMSLTATADILTQVARAIGRAHDAGIVHRDLKPENIFLVQNDDAELVKVLDFGIAKAMGSPLSTSAPETRTGVLLGTPYYMSPEQAQGERSVDARTDLWAMAVIAFECLVGRRPFESDHVGSLVLKICVQPQPVPSAAAEVPEGFDEWFAQGTARDPEQRFRSARELADSLSRLAGTKAALAATQSPVDPFASTAAVDSPKELRQQLSTTAQAAAALATKPSAQRARGSFGLVLYGILLLVIGGGAWLLLSRAAATGEALERAGDAASAASLGPSAAPVQPLLSSSAPPAVAPATSGSAASEVSDAGVPDVRPPLDAGRTGSPSGQHAQPNRWGL